MKTPMQELIEVLKIHRDMAYAQVKVYPHLAEYYDGRGQAFEDAISFAELDLNREKEIICNAFDDYTHFTSQLNQDGLLKNTLRKPLTPNENERI